MIEARDSGQIADRIKTPVTWRLQRPNPITSSLKELSDLEPNKPVFVFLSEGKVEASVLTARDLYARAGAIAGAIGSYSSRGDRALLLYRPGLEFIATFFGCLLAGVVAVPTYPPTRSRTSEGADRIRCAVSQSQARLVLTDSAGSANRLHITEYAGLGSVEWLNTERVQADRIENADPILPLGGDIAFIQFTSGSTREPRGTVITHSNLIANLGASASFYRFNQNTVVASWLPQYHDMGLIGAILLPVFCGGRAVLMSPTHFLRRPKAWLDSITQYAADLSVLPNFALDYCVRHVSVSDRDSLDLSLWTKAVVGAEPIHPDALDRFVEYFSPVGFRREALCPAYGLAECTLSVALTRPHAGPTIKTFDTEKLAEGRAITTSGGSARARRLVSSGTSVDGLQIRIVDPTSKRPCSAGEVGEIWVSGTSVSPGYLDLDSENSDIFHASLSNGDGSSYLRTGDLGCLYEDQLYVVGRLKDILIVRGRNIAPQDVEWSASSCHAALRPNSCVVFQIGSDSAEHIVLVQEVAGRNLTNDSLDAIATSIRRRVFEDFGISLHGVLLTRHGSIPRTTSGKFQRRACERAFLRGELPIHYLWQAREQRTQIQRQDTAVATTDITSSLDDLIGRIQRIVTEVFELNPAALPDPFYPIRDFGLDSLSAAQLLVEIETKIGGKVSMEDLLAGASIRDIAASIDLRTQTRSTKAPLPPDLGSISPVPLSAAQARIWDLVCRSDADQKGVVAIAYRIDGDLNLDALIKSADIVIRRHDILCSVVSDSGSEPTMSLVSRSREDYFVFESLPANCPDAESVAATVIDRNVAGGIDLRNGPLIRFLLLRVRHDLHILTMSSHRIVFDGWSFAILNRELAASYSACINNREGFPPAVSIQMAQYSAWERTRAAGEGFSPHLSFWSEQLREIQRLGSMPPAEHFRSAEIHTDFPEFAIPDLRKLFRQERCSHSAGVLAATCAALFIHSGQPEITLGYSVPNRAWDGGKHTIGPLDNTFLVTVRIARGTRLIELVRDVNRQMLECLKHLDVPFQWAVANGLGSELRDRTPLFPFKLEFLRSCPELILEDRLRCNVWRRFESPVAFDVNVRVIVDFDEAMRDIQYNASKYTEQDAYRIAWSMSKVLKRISEDPSCTVDEVFA